MAAEEPEGQKASRRRTAPRKPKASGSTDPPASPRRTRKPAAEGSAPTANAAAAPAVKPARRRRAQPPPSAPIAASTAGGFHLLARRPGRFLAAAGVITLACILALFVGPLLFKYVPLAPDARVNLLIDPSSPNYADQSTYASTFGADPVLVMVEAPAGQQVLYSCPHLVTELDARTRKDLAAAGKSQAEQDQGAQKADDSFYQACGVVVGNRIKGLSALEDKLGQGGGVKQVYGPASLLQTFAVDLPRQAQQRCKDRGDAAQAKAQQDAAAAGKSQAEQTTAGQQAFDAAVQACAKQYSDLLPVVGRPFIDDPQFQNTILFEPDGSHIRPFWNWALPDARHALITARLDSDASLTDIRSAVNAARDASHDQRLAGLQVVVSGIPALTSSLAQAVVRSLEALLPLTLLAMLLVTVIVLRVPNRLLAVPLAALAGIWTAAAAAALRLPVTPATLAVIPIVLGLATDYSLQAVNRLAEEEGEPRARVSAVVRTILPATGIAAAATAAGVLAFALSPIPLVRQFAFFMALGVAMAYLTSILVGLPALAVLTEPRFARFRRREGPAPSWGRLAAAGRAPLAAVIALTLLGLAGWAAVPFLRIETDPVRLMPAGDPALAQADQVRQAIGIVGELDLVVTGDRSNHNPNTASPEAVAWLNQVSTIPPKRAPGDLKVINGLPTYLSSVNQGKPPDPKTAAQFLAQSPAYFSNAVISPDRSVARSVYGIGRLTSVADDGRLVNLLKSLPAPPKGYRAFPAGLTVVATDALSQLQADSLKLNLLAVVAVLVVLAIAYRRPRPVLLALAPSVVAAGWATGLIFVSGRSAGPITILLAGIVVAFATEFSVLWLTRYRAEIRSGAAVAAASETASRRVGPAIVASALALVFGFLVLALPIPALVTPVPMVQDFGFWCAVDLALATLAVLVLLPPLARRWMVA